MGLYIETDYIDGCTVLVQASCAIGEPYPSWGDLQTECIPCQKQALFVV